MRTTIELSEEIRTGLIKLAAERGDKGYSRVIEEAVREYLARHNASERAERVAGIRALTGSISRESGDRIEAAIKEVRENWRAGSSTPTS